MSRGSFILNHDFDSIQTPKSVKDDELEFEGANRAYEETTPAKKEEEDDHEGLDAVALLELAGTFFRPEEAIEVDVPQAAAPPSKKVSFRQLYRFADKKDMVLMTLGFFTAIIQGFSINAIPFITGTVINDYIAQVLPLLEMNSTANGTCQTNTTVDLYSNIMSIAATATRNVTIAITINCLSGFTHMACWVYTAERQALAVRKRAFYNILHQHTGYFDKHQGGEINSILADDASRFQAGIGDKVGLTIHWLTVFLGATTVSMIKSWQVTLCTLCIVPIALLSGALASLSIKKSSREEAKAYAAAGGVAEEALANIRIVTAFAGQEKERERYSSLLMESKNVGVKSAYIISMAQSISWLIVFCVGAVIFWYGGIRVVYHGMAGGNLFMIMLEMISGLRSLSWVGPNIEAISTAQGSAFGLFELCDVVSEINSADESGDIPASCEGRIEFKNIRFCYPAREEVEVLKGLSMEIRPGQTAALVGPSGCGKSTTIQLLQRLYDPGQGGVLVDGRDVREYNLKWLRQQIGVVSQEPVLFAATIEENIRFGRDSATREEVMVAAKEADAHDFIMKLPQKYDTLLNEQGTQLSRGEKQRISLARALVRQPRMLLLDEATSALDNESEAVVQAALDKAAKGRTTIVIAHRLSTVRDANILFVVDKGVVSELGTHQQLIDKKGLYHLLVKNQTKAGGDEDKKEEEKKHMDFPTAARKMTVISLKGFRSGSIVPNELEEFQKILGEEETLTPVPLKRVLEMNKPEYFIMTIGGISAVVIGFVWPIFAYFLGFVIETVTTPCLSQETESYQLNLSAASVIIEGLLATGVSFVMLVCFKYSGEYLTLRVRAKAFAVMLRQEIGWFDDPRNQVGTLTSKLANEASRVKMSTGSALSSVLSSSSTVILAAAADVVFGWPLGLALIPLMPLTILAAILQGYFNRALTQQGASAVENSGKIASEAVDKVRTIASLTKEDFFMEKYEANYAANKARGRKKGYIIGGTWAMLYGVLGVQFILAIGFGLYLVSIYMIPFHAIFSILFVTLIASLEMGRANAYMPEITSARAAATNLFALYDRQSLLDPEDEAGLVPKDTNCEINIKDVVFYYPTRPNIRVLDHYHMSAKRGEFIAMCGPSGGGKSTAIQLMERFYDVPSDKGDVTYDGRPVQELNSRWLREQMSIVTQEPVLFSWSLRENIAYGDNSREVPMEEIITASKAANIHSFIATLPKGYDTTIGSKGNQLSGGQKQRVSIARALVRNPKILLLDDATSALDSASEKVVEEALEKAREGRTAVVVSHRLSSILKANRIMYVDKGHVLESGTHDELMSKKAYYYKLQQANLGFKHTK